MTENQIEQAVRRTLVDNKMLGSVAYSIKAGMTLGGYDGYRVLLDYLDNGVATGIRRGMVFSYIDTDTLEKKINELILQLKEDADERA